MIAADRNAFTLRCSMKTSVGIEEAFRVRLDYRMTWCGILTSRAVIDWNEPPFLLRRFAGARSLPVWRTAIPFHPTESGTWSPQCSRLRSCARDHSWKSRACDRSGTSVVEPLKRRFHQAWNLSTRGAISH